MGAAERAILSNVLRLREVTAEDVMVPRADIVAIELDVDLDKLAAFLAREAHSRVPVYRGTLDDVVGFVHLKDVLRARETKSGAKLADVMRKVIFVAPSMRVLDLLLEMRKTRTHIALVVDEFGGVDGLVTIEDVVEAIVGDIEDEHDVDERPRLQKGRRRLAGRSARVDRGIPESDGLDARRRNPRSRYRHGGRCRRRDGRPRARPRRSDPACRRLRVRDHRRRSAPHQTPEGARGTRRAIARNRRRIA